MTAREIGCLEQKSQGCADFVLFHNVGVDPPIHIIDSNNISSGNQGV